MKSMQVDVAVIGAGTSGIVAYRAAKAEGLNVLLIEGGAYGTTCARVGCMPSKLLIAAADAAHATGRAAGFGIYVEGSIRIDGREVMARVRRERDRFVASMVSAMERIPQSDHLQGHAVFLDNHLLAVGNHTRVTAKSIVIATGSHAVYPDSFKHLNDRLIISDDVFGWHDLPKSVAVMGLGIVGLEIGQALHRLGVRVALFGRDGNVGPLSDPEILDYALATFKQEFSLEADANVTDMQLEGGSVAIRRTLANGEQLTEHFEYVLAATGRAPNVQNIGLEETTLRFDAKGVPLYDTKTTQTVSSNGSSPIYIAGDAGNFIPLLHEAADEGYIAGKNAARFAKVEPVQPGLRRASLGVVFTDPQIGIIGGGFKALKPGSFVTGQASFEDQGRARMLLQNKGLANLYADRTSGLFLGAEIMAPAAEHLAHLLAWALQNKMTVAQILEMPFYHPVLEEGLRSALQDLNAKLRSGRNTSP